MLENAIINDMHNNSVSMILWEKDLPTQLRKARPFLFIKFLIITGFLSVFQCFRIVGVR